MPLRLGSFALDGEPNAVGARLVGRDARLDRAVEATFLGTPDGGAHEWLLLLAPRASLTRPGVAALVDLVSGPAGLFAIAAPAPAMAAHVASDHAAREALLRMVEITAQLHESGLFHGAMEGWWREEKGALVLAGLGYAWFLAGQRFGRFEEGVGRDLDHLRARVGALAGAPLEDLGAQAAERLRQRLRLAAAATQPGGVAETAARQLAADLRESFAEAAAAPREAAPTPAPAEVPRRTMLITQAPGLGAKPAAGSGPLATAPPPAFAPPVPAPPVASPPVAAPPLPPLAAPPGGGARAGAGRAATAYLPSAALAGAAPQGAAPPPAPEPTVLLPAGSLPAAGAAPPVEKTMLLPGGGAPAAGGPVAEKTMLLPAGGAPGVAGKPVAERTVLLPVGGPSAAPPAPPFAAPAPPAPGGAPRTELLPVGAAAPAQPASSGPAPRTELLHQTPGPVIGAPRRMPPLAGPPGGPRAPGDGAPAIETIIEGSVVPADLRAKTQPVRRARVALVVAVLGLLLLVGVAVVAAWWWLAHRRAAAQATAPVATVTARPAPAAAPAALLPLSVTAAPWGVATVRTAAGEPVAAAGAPQPTPLTLQLPAGRYVVTVANPALGGTEQRCEVELAPGKPAACRLVLRPPSADDYFRAVGWR